LGQAEALADVLDIQALDDKGSGCLFFTPKNLTPFPYARYQFVEHIVSHGYSSFGGRITNPAYK
jgi:hypothetical protein